LQQALHAGHIEREHQHVARLASAIVFHAEAVALLNYALHGEPAAQLHPVRAEIIPERLEQRT
jgi:hypothetical protein